MSRSYKKNPIATDGHANSTKESKRFANKRVRKTLDENSPKKGSFYKKLFCSYDIHDWKNRWTWNEAKESWEKGENTYLKNKYPTLKEFYRYWLKCCKSK